MTELPGLSADLCLKCNICTAACPVAAVTDLFPGPKAVGPQEERFRHPRLPVVDRSVAWCSGCGVCSRVCPHGVPVTEINVRAKAALAQQHGFRLREQLISRPALLGRLGVRIAAVANAALSNPLVRRLTEATLGISRHGPLPAFSRYTLRSTQAERISSQPPASASGTRLEVAYFHGCSTEYYEPWIGKLAIAILEKLDCRVVLPPQGGCGLPLQSNGLFDAARRYARTNVGSLVPFADAGIPIVGTSTSCTLALKHEYRAILGLEGEDVDKVAGAIFDFFEFLMLHRMPQLERQNLHPVPQTVLYHPPCQLRGHGIGTPALEVLRRVPGLEIVLSEAECCGIAGTYGLKRERASVAADVGRVLFDQARDMKPDLILSDSETCRWWIQMHTGLESLHPVQILARAMNLE
jgi:glycerol-3-phosphate dehydrogenase subunit C